MAELHLHVSVLIIGFLLLCVGLGESWFDAFKAIQCEVGVDNSCFQRLVGPVEHLQHVAADELVVCVDSDHDRLKGTVLHRVYVDVGKRSLSSFVFKQNVLALVDAVEGKVSAIDLYTAVTGVIVHNNHEVVAVILRENRV